MELSRFLSHLILAAILHQVSPSSLSPSVEEIEDKVFLHCNSSVVWLEGTVGTELAVNKNLDLGKRILDPRGTYMCEGIDKKSTLQIYYRMCQNCVELHPGTLAGIIVADIVATLLLALGVYCFTGHETGRLSGAVDTQTLLRNEQLYQPLRDHDDGQYSRLGGNWASNK
ncbi:T-cell surface glycoprotein CD3 delta chain isoform X1 [Marmota flaviventris]|uniref:T-cell surface glycoprotein CD3 delta chain isoform X1 n=1 Tax=Marmota flaviventris TaxID=93162 RepID=UPI000FFF7D37|nr:T-cell surface glycoprotein CD3 delta chain isoform X1 [Marmota flaviventris]